MADKKKYTIGITLSGGGARGIAHIGVLKALEEENIFPEIISGCSAGAIIGALYAEGHSPEKIFSFIEKKSMFSIVKMGLPARGFMEIAYFRDILTKHIAHNDFKHLKKPFYVSVTNLNKGQYEIIHSGKIIDFVIASSSIPLLFKPQKIDDEWYVDGGVMNNLPVACIRDQCKYLIGVNVNPMHYQHTFDGMAAIGQRILDIALKVNMDSVKAQCDTIIETDTHLFNPFSLNKAKEIYAKGYEATRHKMEEIKLGIAQYNN
jgi:NTE family protein